MNNLSTVSDDRTARTDPECAVQRAVHMASLLKRGDTVLELCVGPSLKVLESAYDGVGLKCVGNDVDHRWRRYYQVGFWLMGDALKVDWLGADGIVFAPPLSRGCSGKRADSLRIEDVNPTYRSFLERLDLYREARTPKVACLVLPARSIATAHDRDQFYHLLKDASAFGQVHPVELTSGWRKCRKYVDVYIELFK